MSGIVADLEEILNWVEKSASDSINQVADLKEKLATVEKTLEEFKSETHMQVRFQEAKPS